jgi:lipopolysaccharide biosynthesis glycosyltransferase
MNSVIPCYVGYDPRERAGYHVWCESVIQRCSQPVAFIPLHGPMLNDFDGQKDGSNAFIYSRFLVPYLTGYTGYALFVDGDMCCLEDLAQLWEFRKQMVFDKSVAVVKHNYKTRHDRKYIGTPMEADNQDYPRKNWTSVMLWNCAHFANRILTPEFVREAPGSFLHRFSWLKDDQIAELPPEWNVLAEEQDTSGAKLIHYTLGAPGFEHYQNCEGSEHWHRTLKAVNHLEGETRERRIKVHAVK